MLYTVVPREQIFRESPGGKAVFSEDSRFYLREDKGEKIIDRIVSTDPSDYLKEEYYPGKIYFE